MSTHSILVEALDEYLETHTPTVCVLVKMDEGQGPGRKRQAIDACKRVGTLRDTSTTNPDPHPNPNPNPNQASPAFTPQRPSRAACPSTSKLRVRGRTPNETEWTSPSPCRSLPCYWSLLLELAIGGSARRRTRREEIWSSGYGPLMTRV